MTFPNAGPHRVRFLDELAQLSSLIVDTLPEPMHHGRVTIARGSVGDVCRAGLVALL